MPDDADDRARRRAQAPTDAAADGDSGSDGGGLKEKIAPVVSKAQSSRAVRSLQRYTATSGPILASGLAYQLLFAAFAGIWVGFAIFGSIVSGKPSRHHPSSAHEGPRERSSGPLSLPVGASGTG